MTNGSSPTAGSDASHSSVAVLVVERGAPAIAPATLRRVEVASPSLGGPAVLDREGRLTRELALLGRLFARRKALGRLLVQLLGHGGGPADAGEPAHDDRA